MINNLATRKKNEQVFEEKSEFSTDFRFVENYFRQEFVRRRERNWLTVKNEELKFLSRIHRFDLEEDFSRPRILLNLRSCKPKWTERNVSFEMFRSRTVNTESNKS